MPDDDSREETCGAIWDLVYFEFILLVRISYYGHMCQSQEPKSVTICHVEQEQREGILYFFL